MKNSLYLVAALALASCDRSEPTPAQKPIEPTTTSPSPATPEESAAKREMQPTASDSRWSKTWDRFTGSDQKKFEDDDYVIERAENGAADLPARAGEPVITLDLARSPRRSVVAFVGGRAGARDREQRPDSQRYDVLH